MKTLKITLLIFVAILTAAFVVEKQPKKIVEIVTIFDDETPYKASMDGWEVDVNKAYEISKKTGKPIMANFTGSDWCGWCIKLKNEVFTKEEFKTWAKKNVVLLELDFPRRFQLPEDIKQQNYGLQQAFGVVGYPTIWVFNLSKTETGQYNIDALGKTGYVAGGPSKFQEGVEAMVAQYNAAKK